MCSGYKLDRTGDTVHPEGTAGACYHSCCDTRLSASGDSACWDGDIWMFDACCLQVSASGTTSAGSSHGGSSYTYGGSSYTHGGSSYTHGGSSYVQHTSGSMHQQSYNHYETTAAAHHSYTYPYGSQHTPGSMHDNKFGVTYGAPRTCVNQETNKWSQSRVVEFAPAMWGNIAAMKEALSAALASGQQVCFCIKGYDQGGA